MSSSEEHLETLAEIRDLMKRSSRFLSLSGLSGVCAGVFALAGAAVAYFYLRESFLDFRLLAQDYPSQIEGIHLDLYKFFFLDAGTVLLLSLLAGWYFSKRKAQKQGIPFWDMSASRALINLMIPLVTGGCCCLALLYHNVIGFIPGATLVFYGLALINASKYTLNEIRYLGCCEIVLGLAALWLVGYGLLFWTIGFGVLHVVYGAVMYYKYER